MLAKNLNKHTSHAPSNAVRLAYI